MIETEANQDAERMMQNCSIQESKMNSKVNPPAGIKTSYDDENRFQRRHFRNSMSSDIFFCSVPSDNSVTPDNNAEQDNVCIPAGSDTPNADQTESDKQNFNVSPENFVTPKSNGDEDYSCNQSENETLEKRHFHVPPENFVTPEHNADEDYSSMVAGNKTHEEEFEKRHFHAPSENFVTPVENADQHEEVDSAKKAKSIETEADDTDQKKTQRRHFCDKTSSNIFFGDLQE